MLDHLDPLFDRRVRRAVDVLNWNEKMALWLLICNRPAITQTKLGEIMGISQSRVRQILHEAIDKLKQRLKELGCVE